LQGIFTNARVYNSGAAGSLAPFC